ncbi:MAG: hypothetical protein NDJ90_09070 [Oligoflexia bacterium]|nr:hypothetical protein [Oligoflexia bacterium]
MRTFLLSLPVMGLLLLAGVTETWAVSRDATLGQGPAQDAVALVDVLALSGRPPGTDRIPIELFAADGVGHESVFDGSQEKAAMVTGDGRIPAPGEITPSTISGQAY